MDSVHVTLYSTLKFTPDKLIDSIINIIQNHNYQFIEDPTGKIKIENKLVLPKFKNDLYKEPFQLYYVFESNEPLIKHDLDVFISQKEYLNMDQPKYSPINKKEFIFDEIDLVYNSNLFQDFNHGNYEEKLNSLEIVDNTYSLLIELYNKFHPFFGNYEPGLGAKVKHREIFNLKIPRIYPINIFSPEYINKIEKTKFLALTEEITNKILKRVSNLEKKIQRAYLPLLVEFDDGGILYAPSYHPYAYEYIESIDTSTINKILHILKRKKD